MIKRELHTKPKLNMFLALSLNYQQSFGKKKHKYPETKLSEKLRSGTKISVGHTVLELLIKTCKIFVLINNSRTALPTKLSTPFLRFSVSQFAFRYLCHFSKQCLQFRDSEQNMLNFGLGCSSHRSFFLLLLFFQVKYLLTICILLIVMMMSFSHTIPCLHSTCH